MGESRKSKQKRNKKNRAAKKQSKIKVKSSIHNEIPPYILARRTDSFKKCVKDIHIDNFVVPRPGGGSELLTETKFKLINGRRYGLVGRNGFGKTTLLSLISSGKLSEIPKSWHVLHVKQEMPTSDKTVIQTVLDSDEERKLLLEEESKFINQKNKSEKDNQTLSMVYERLEQIESSTAETRAATILSGLAFSQSNHEFKIKDLSGGWRMRVSLACALFAEPDLLLLDEPTNHLDFPAVEWLTNHLNHYSKTLIVVSHDRNFLNNIATDIMHIENQKLFYYKGNFNTFEKVRKEHRKQAKTAYDKQQATIEHNEDFIRRFRANKKLSSLAQSRMKLLAGMTKLEDVKVDATFEFRFPEPTKLKKENIMMIEDMSFGYYGDIKESLLFEKVHLRLDMKTVVGILGANGKGKSTLVNLILNKLEPVSGKIVVNNSVNIGFFAQHHAEMLDLDLTPYEYLKKKFSNETHQQIYHKLGQFNLAKNCANKKIRILSGGEKSRISFAELTWHDPHLLILDEPTNHLDMDMIEALIKAIKAYSGAVIVISHDQYFLSKICDEFWAIGPEKIIKSFKLFKEGRTFSYSHKTPTTFIPHLPEKVDNRVELNEKKEKEEEIKGKSKKNKNKEFEIKEDTLYLIERAVTLKKSPQQIIRVIKNIKPDKDSTKESQLLSNYTFTNYFDNKYNIDRGADEIDEMSPILQHMIPHDHIESQLTILFTLQGIWYTSNKDNNKIAIKKDSLLYIFKKLYKLNIVCSLAFKKWTEDTKNRISGKEKALLDTKLWIDNI